jgi:hypothetical protein
LNLRENAREAEAARHERSNLVDSAASTTAGTLPDFVDHAATTAGGIAGGPAAGPLSPTNIGSATTPASGDEMEVDASSAIAASLNAPMAVDGPTAPVTPPPLGTTVGVEAATIGDLVQVSPEHVPGVDAVIDPTVTLRPTCHLRETYRRLGLLPILSVATHASLSSQKRIVRGLPITFSQSVSEGRPHFLTAVSAATTSVSVDECAKESCRSDMAASGMKLLGPVRARKTPEILFTALFSPAQSASENRVTTSLSSGSPIHPCWRRRSVQLIQHTSLCNIQSHGGVQVVTRIARANVGRSRSYLAILAAYRIFMSTRLAAVRRLDRHPACRTQAYSRRGTECRRA